MGGKRTVQQKKDGKSREPFVMVPCRWMDLPAWRHLSGSAVKVLLHLIRLSGGDNGFRSPTGGLFLSERKAATDLGLARNTASAAFDMLDMIGWIKPVGAKGSYDRKAGGREQRATVWRLTFQVHPQSKRGPTMEFRDWQPEENRRDQKLSSSGAEIAPLSETERETGAEIEPVSEAPPSERENPFCSKSDPHLDIAIGKRSEGDAPNSERPAIEPNGLPPQEVVRQRVERHCLALDSQGRLRFAARAQLSAQELQQFLAGRLFVQPQKLAALRSLVTPQPQRQVA